MGDDEGEHFFVAGDDAGAGSLAFDEGHVAEDLAGTGAGELDGEALVLPLHFHFALDDDVEGGLFLAFLDQGVAGLVAPALGSLQQLLMLLIPQELEYFRQGHYAYLATIRALSPRPECAGNPPVCHVPDISCNTRRAASSVVPMSWALWALDMNPA